jgi:hypothetical protein
MNKKIHSIKKEEDLFKFDLSNQDGTYTKALNDNMSTVNELGNDFTVDLKTYVSRILEIVKPANDTPAKRKFVATLMSQRDKTNAMLYVSNAYLRGCGLESIG